MRKQKREQLQGDSRFTQSWVCYFMRSTIAWFLIIFVEAPPVHIPAPIILPNENKPREVPVKAKNAAEIAKEKQAERLSKTLRQ